MVSCEVLFSLNLYTRRTSTECNLILSELCNFCASFKNDEGGVWRDEVLGQIPE